MTLSHTTEKQGTTLEPLDFARWFEERSEMFAERWLAQVVDRRPAGGVGAEELLGRFLSVLTRMLPKCVGQYREHVEPLWLQTSDLFGSVAARRGLAAGEGLEEFQLLRELVIRELYADPPAGGQLIALRDLLRLNRVLDRGAVQVAVGHADAIFFALFRGSGVPEHLNEEVVQEVAAQLTALAEEFKTVTRPR
jgi:hypothetical protein